MQFFTHHRFLILLAVCVLTAPFISITTTDAGSPSTEKKDAPSMALQGDNIVIGSSLPLESYAKMYGISIRNGLSLPIDKANDQGGIKGKIIKLVTLDDSYTPESTRKNIDTFLSEYKTDIILSPYGDPTLETYLDLVKEKKVLVLFPNTEVGISLPYVIQFRTSYKEQGTVLADYVIKEKNAKKIAIIYHDDVWSREGKDGAEAVFKKAGMAESDYLFVKIDRKILTLKEQIEAVKTFNPDAIGFYALSVSAREILDGLDIGKINKATLFGMDTVSEKRFEDFLKKKGLTIITANIVPNPMTSEIEIVEEYRKEAEKKGIPINTTSLEAYINASFFVDILKRLEKPINKENIVELIEQTKDYPFKGLTLSYKHPGLLHSLWLDPGDGSEWKEIQLRKD